MKSKIGPLAIARALASVASVISLGSPFCEEPSVGVAVTTSRYGDPGFYEPEYRGARAFDGDTDTAWEVGAHAPVIGERLRVDLYQPISTDHAFTIAPDELTRLTGAIARVLASAA